MRYISKDGEEQKTTFDCILHNMKRRLDAACHGKLTEFEEMMKAEKGEDQYENNRYRDAWVDWATGFVRMYGPKGQEIAAIKIDTEYYRKGIVKSTQ